MSSAGSTTLVAAAFSATRWKAPRDDLGESAGKVGGSVLGRVALVVLVGLIGPAPEWAGQADLVGTELKCTALEPVEAGDHRVPAPDWAGIAARPTARSSCRSGM